METTWKQVTTEEFFSTVGTLNVHPSILPGRWPYTSIWKTPEGYIKGKSIFTTEYDEFGKQSNLYYIPA